MKSICGYWALDGAPTSPDTLLAMRVAAVRCASPHREQWQGESLAFGAAWWSPQSDLQPAQCIAQHSATGCVVVADARLDNPAELRVALDLQAPAGAPDSTTDHAATLILHAWLRWGEDCVDHIDGDFAFAVHDPRHNLVYLARDRMGERPLYVHHEPGKQLVFGSTSHSVLAHPRVSKDINEARIADYLLEGVGGGLEGVDFTSTFHLAVERHPPRRATLVTPQQYRQRRYWALEPGKAGPLPKTDDEWAEALIAAMDRAVAQRLSGPQRVGSMLSGGLDSTSLAIIAGDQLHAAGKLPLPTFSAIDSSRSDCLETRAVRIAAQMPIFQSTLIDIANLGDLRSELDRFLDEFDEPFDAGMALLDSQYAAAALKGLDSVIDGGNGDSLFLPGNTLRRQIRSGHWLTAWRNAKGLTRFGGRPWDHLRGPLSSALVPDWLRTWLAPTRDRRWQHALLNKALLSPDFACRTQVGERLRRLTALRSPLPLQETAPEAAEALMHTFPVAGAERYARVAARHGITPLSPFSEHNLLELCVHLPDRQRLHGGWTKPVLRHAMRERMPDPVRLRHDKQHLGQRLSHTLWKQRSNHLETILLARRHMLEPYINLKRLDAAAERQRNSAVLTAWGQMLFAVRLAHWLAARSTPTAFMNDARPKA